MYLQIKKRMDYSFYTLKGKVKLWTKMDTLSFVECKIQLEERSKKRNKFCNVADFRPIRETHPQRMMPVIISKSIILP